MQLRHFRPGKGTIDEAWGYRNVLNLHAGLRTDHMTPTSSIEIRYLFVRYHASCFSVSYTAFSNVALSSITCGVPGTTREPKKPPTWLTGSIHCEGYHYLVFDHVWECASTYPYNHGGSKPHQRAFLTPHTQILHNHQSSQTVVALYLSGYICANICVLRSSTRYSLSLTCGFNSSATLVFERSVPSFRRIAISNFK